MQHFSAYLRSPLYSTYVTLMKLIQYTALHIRVSLRYELWHTLISNIEVFELSEYSHMEHMKLSDSGISYSITLCESIPHCYIWKYYNLYPTLHWDYIRCQWNVPYVVILYFHSLI